MPKQIRWVGQVFDEIVFESEGDLSQEYVIQRGGHDNTLQPVIINDSDVEFFLTYPGENIVVEEADEPEEEADETATEDAESAPPTTGPRSRVRG